MMRTISDSPVTNLVEGIKSGLKDLTRRSLLDYHGPIKTESNLPGRVRFRCAVLAGASDTGAFLAESLNKLPGVSSVEVNGVSGSALIHYDPERLSPEILFTAMLKLLHLEDEFLRTPQPFLAKEIRNVGSSLNRAVYDLTCGLTDLWTSLFILLAVLGFSKLKTDPTRALPGGITLLWWAYISLMKEKSSGG